MSQWFLEEAKHLIDSQDYPAAGEAALRSLQEVIDAKAVRENVDFFDEYPYEAWTKRLQWIKKRNSELEPTVARFVDALVFSCASTESELMECIQELEHLLFLNSKNLS